MIKLKEIIIEGGSCPYQLEAITEEGKYFYLRYRDGFLRAGIADSEKEFWEKVNYNIIMTRCGEYGDGYMRDSIFENLKGIVSLPEGFRFCSEHETA